MAEEQKNSSAETVDAAASAAHTVKGAIKAGKAISGAAKGAAAAGPYGAVAGAVWAGRKHIGKIIAVIAILLLLPVLFLLMLPGLIFGGLVNAFSPADPDTPILNSETAIVENANDITFAINAILGEALDDVMARIEVDFASSGADKMEVKNPYSSGLVYNANLIVSQYCAARDEDFESISLDDLSTVLRENKEHLYSYTSVRESREVTSEDPETGEETISTEIWMIYTIRYNGESYLADHVFALTDEQKELASDYASNLSLFLGDGLLQNVDEWTGNSKIILNLEDDEAERVQETLHLSDAETMEVTHFERGSGLISTNNNNIMVEFKASPLEKDLITTDRRELRELLERKRQEQADSA